MEISVLRVMLVTTFAVLFAAAAAQADTTTVVSDDFNRALLSGGATTWNITNTTSSGTASIVSNQLQLSSTGGSNGRTSVATGLTGLPGYSTTLDGNAGDLTWSFNMRFGRTTGTPGGFASGAYANAFVLASDNQNFAATNSKGYAVLFGNSSTPDTFRLVAFNNGVTADLTTAGTSAPNALIIGGSGSPFSVSTQAASNDYYSFQVTYSPSTEVWSFSGRDDGASGFSDPTSGSMTSIGTFTETSAIFRTTPLANMGAMWNYATGTGQNAQFDNFTLTVGAGSGGSNNAVWNTTSGTWDIGTSPNWTGATGSVYTEGNNVTFNNASGGTVTLNTTVMPGTTTVSASGGTYVFTGGGSINGSGALVKSGSGTLDLSGLSAGNGYNGGTTVTGGKLIISANNQLGDPSGFLNISNGGTLSLAGPIFTARPLTIGAGGATIAMNGNNFAYSAAAATVINDVLTTTGSGVISVGSTTLTFGASGALNIGAGGAVSIIGASTVITMSAGGTFNGDLIIGGPERMNFNGAGKTYGGTGKIYGLGGSLGAGNGGVMTTSGSFSNTNLLISNASSGSGGTITSNIVLNPADSGPLMGHVPFTPGDITTANYTSASFLAFFGGTTNGNTMAVNGVISGESDVYIGNDSRKGGGGATLILGAANTYQGNTLINSSAVLQLGTTNTLPTTTNVVYGSLSGAGAAAIDLNGNDQAVASISDDAYKTTSNNHNYLLITNSGARASTLTVGGPITPANAFGGVITDGVNKINLRKTGINTLTLTASQGYTGATTINGGKLSIGGSGSINSTSNVTINGSGAEFNYNSSVAYSGGPISLVQGAISGTGAIGKLVSVGSNAILSPGNGVGAQAYTAGLTLANGGDYRWEIGDWVGTTAGTHFDQANVSGGSLDFSTLTSGSFPGNTFKIDITGLTSSSGSLGAVPNFDSTLARSWNIIASTGAQGTFNANLFTLDTSNFVSNNPLNGGSFSLAFSSNNLVLNYTPSASATSYYWVGNDAVRGGAGTWASAGGNAWATTDADTAGVAWDSSKTAVFGGASPTSAVTVSGTVSVANNVVFNSDGYTLSGGVLLLSGSAQAVNTITAGAGTAVINTVLAGSQGMTKAGGGALVLTASNVYTGDTTITGGTLQLGNGGTSGSIVGNVNDGGTFAINRADAVAFAGDISGAGGIYKSGAGVLSFQGNNSFSGKTVIAGGAIATSDESQFGVNPAIFTADQITLDGGSIRSTGSLSFANNRGITLGASGGTLDTAGNSIGIAAGTIAGVGSLTKLGSGTLTLDGANSYTGKTIINEGFIATSGESRFGANPGTFVADQITLNGGGIQASTGNINFSSNRGIALGAAGGTLDTSGNTITVSATNPISGNGSLTKYGGGTLILAASNTFNGGLVINDGTVQISNPAALNSTAPNSVTFAAGASSSARLQLNGNNVTISSLNSDSEAPGGPVVENGAAGVSILNVKQNTGASTFAGVLQDGSGGGKLGLTKSGVGALNVTASNGFSGPTLIEAGSLRLANSAALGTSPLTIVSGSVLASAEVAISNPITVPSAANSYTVTYDFSTASPTSITSPLISASDVSQGNNNGTTVLITGASPSSGYPNVSGGSNAGAAARTGVLNVGSSGSAYFEFTLTPTAGSVSFNSISFGERSTSTGPQAFNLRSSLDNFTSDLSSGTLDNDANWRLITPTLLATSSSGSPITYRIYGSGGSGSPNPSTANWRIDDLKLSGSATVAVGTPVLGSDISSGTATFTGPISLSSSLTLTAAAGGAATISGNISSPAGTLASLTKVGAGTVLLSGSNTFTGGTIVSEGTLIVANTGAIPDGSSLVVGDASMFPPLAPSTVVPAAMATAVPEPGTLLLLAAGAALLGIYRKLRRQ
jgi:autotransporter-associated beta strand protein